MSIKTALSGYGQMIVTGPSKILIYYTLFLYHGRIRLWALYKYIMFFLQQRQTAVSSQLRPNFVLQKNTITSVVFLATAINKLHTCVQNSTCSFSYIVNNIAA